MGDTAWVRGQPGGGATCTLMRLAPAVEQFVPHSGSCHL